MDSRIFLHLYNVFIFSNCVINSKIICLRYFVKNIIVRARLNRLELQYIDNIQYYTTHIHEFGFLTNIQTYSNCSEIISWYVRISEKFDRLASDFFSQFLYYSFEDSMYSLSFTSSSFNISKFNWGNEWAKFNWVLLVLCFSHSSYSVGKISVLALLPLRLGPLKQRK